MVNIGVISDTHSLLRPEALNVLQGSDHIIHAGDIGSPDVLERLEKIAPLTIVRGNIDTDAWAATIPVTNVSDIHGVLLYVLHDLKSLDLNPVVSGFAAVISGHSHAPKAEWRDGVLYFNPGSAGPRRFKLPLSIGRIRIEGKLLKPELILLQV
jgi:putative phosphoesterase